MATWKCNLCNDDDGKAFRVPVDEIGKELMKGHLEDSHGVDWIVPQPVRYSQNDPAQQWNEDLRRDK